MEKILQRIPALDVKKNSSKLGYGVYPPSVKCKRQTKDPSPPQYSGPSALHPPSSTKICTHKKKILSLCNSEKCIF